MSLIKKLSDVLKEVFWIKSKSRKNPIIRRKTSSKTKKKTIRKVSSDKLRNLSMCNKKKESTKKEAKKFVLNPKKTEKKTVTKVEQKRLDLLKNVTKVGEITHYFERIGVCVVKITHGSIIIGDKLTVVGIKSSFVQKVWSMQIESQDVKVAKKGQLIGLKIDKPAIVGDIVYK